jgi:hypothetical protein
MAAHWGTSNLLSAAIIFRHADASGFSLMKLIRTTIASLSFLLGCTCFGYFLGLSSRYEAKAKVWAAYHEREASRWKALQAIAELDSKRTDIEAANKKVFLAETRLQRACVKLKGRC